MSDLVGRVLGGRYEILELSGEGGMAEVYKARHIQLDRDVAIKVMHRFLTKEQGFKARFEREAQLGARLHHPHIVEVYDYEARDAEHIYYIVEEFISGPSLASYLHNLEENQTRIPVSEFLRISKDIASALSYAHMQGVIHRDVKPSNILLENEQRVVLTDFGLARLISKGNGSTKLTASDTMLGTPAYMSPEQALGESGDEYSDIYSFGVVMYQMITGHLPFDADSPIAIALKHVNESPMPPSIVDPQIPLAISNLIMCCLNKEPNARYESADHITAELTALEAGFNNTPARAYRPTVARIVPVTDSYIGKHSETITLAPTQPPQNRRGVLVGMTLLPLLALGAFLATGSLLNLNLTNATSTVANSTVVNSSPTPLSNEDQTATAVMLQTQKMRDEQNVMYATQVSLNATQIAANSTLLAAQSTSQYGVYATLTSVAMSATPEGCRLSSTVSTGATVHSGPGFNYPVLGKLGMNVIIPVLGYTINPTMRARWWQVNFNGAAGWVWDTEAITIGQCNAVVTLTPPPTQIPGMPTYTPVVLPTLTAGQAFVSSGHSGNTGNGNHVPNPSRTPTHISTATLSPSGEPPTAISSTNIPPTDVPPTTIPPTDVPPTEVLPTDVPPTDVPPTMIPPTSVPPTAQPMPQPTQPPPTQPQPQEQPSQPPQAQAQSTDVPPSQGQSPVSGGTPNCGCNS